MRVPSLIKATLAFVGLVLCINLIYAAIGACGIMLLLMPFAVSIVHSLFGRQMLAFVLKVFKL